MKKKIKCEKCEKDFIHDFTLMEGGLNLQINILTNDPNRDNETPKFKCPKCNSSYPWENTKESTFQCEKCNNYFEYPSKKDTYNTKSIINKKKYDKTLIFNPVSEAIYNGDFLHYGQQNTSSIDKNSTFYMIDWARSEKIIPVKTRLHNWITLTVYNKLLQEGEIHSISFELDKKSLPCDVSCKDIYVNGKKIDNIIKKDKSELPKKIEGFEANYTWKSERIIEI